ncbi:MAG TPA: hypothetical protein VGA31_05770 [Thermoanaerobaculia bacterium]
MSSLRLSTLLGSALFVFYCTAVGVYLLLRPWTAGVGAGGWTSSGFFRGFVSGLGVVHLFAGASDLRVLSRQLSEDDVTAGRPPR